MPGAVAFYRNVLGLKCLFESTHWTEFEMGQGKFALHLALTDGVGPLGEVGKGWMFGLVTDNIRALEGRVRESGVGTVHDYHQIPSGVTLTIADPDGNPLQLIQLGTTMADLGLPG
ncbi:MAG: hypothetical protein HONBIEJF_02642 [Fimbriimonadaceae bacterium]|nr:hypothetical protein [Fimbriimonadaceae bacterium]